MQNRMPSRRRPAPAHPSGRQGDTVPAQGETQTSERVPRLPHERDESADSQPSGKAPTRQEQAASKDAQRGSVDTDKGPVMDKVYDRVREGADDPRKKFSP